MEHSLGPWQARTEQAFSLVAQPEGVNLGLLVGERSAALIDTGSCFEQGRELAASVATVTERPVSHLLLTHDHYDHADGLAGVLSVFPDAQVIAGVGVVDLPEAHLTEIVSIAGADLGGLWVEILATGAGHSAADLAIFAPGVVFTGDLVESAQDPQIGADADVRGWITALDVVISTMRTTDLVVPGHGPIVDREYAITTRVGLAMVCQRADEQVAGSGFADLGVVAPATGAHIHDEDLPETGFGAETVRAALANCRASAQPPERTRLPLV